MHRGERAANVRLCSCNGGRWRRRGDCGHLPATALTEAATVTLHKHDGRPRPCPMGSVGRLSSTLSFDLPATRSVEATAKPAQDQTPLMGKPTGPARS
jgi:hypothetical protein